MINYCSNKLQNHLYRKIMDYYIFYVHVCFADALRTKWPGKCVLHVPSHVYIKNCSEFSPYLMRIAAIVKTKPLWIL